MWVVHKVEEDTKVEGTMVVAGCRQLGGHVKRKGKSETREARDNLVPPFHGNFNKNI